MNEKPFHSSSPHPEVWTLQDVLRLVVSLLFIGCVLLSLPVYKFLLSDSILSSWRERVEDADELLTSGKTREALEAYDQIIAALPYDNGPALLRDRMVVEGHRFHRLFRAGEYDTCHNYLDLLEDLYSGYPVYEALLLRRRGRVYLAQGKELLAKKAFSRLYHHYRMMVPERAEACYQLGQVFEEEGRCNDAAICYRQAIKIGGPYHPRRSRAIRAYCALDPENTGTKKGPFTK